MFHAPACGILHPGSLQAQRIPTYTGFIQFIDAVRFDGLRPLIHDRVNLMGISSGTKKQQHG